MRNDRGMALIMALASIMIMSMAALEFVYSNSVTYQMAMNERDMLKAEYLAESAFNLMKVELRMEKQIKNQLKSSNISKYIPEDMLNQPLCAQYPLSTELLRGLVQGDSSSGAEGEGEKKAPDGLGDMLTGMSEEKAKKFLAFDGDFEAECESESSKWNVNVFNGLDPLEKSVSGTNAYDIYKRMLLEFFNTPENKKYFFDLKPDDLSKIVRNIADYTDKDERINEFGGIAGGNEDSEYNRGDSFKVKNRKFISLEELYLVKGVTDDWLIPLRNRLTVYGDGKINVCTVDDQIIRGVVAGYSQSNSKFLPINADNKDYMDKAIKIIHNECAMGSPEPVTLSKKIDTLLSGGDVPDEWLELSDETGETENMTPSSTATNGTSDEVGAPSGGGLATAFANYMTTEDRFYTLNATGRVGDISTVISAVVDTKETDPAKWKIVYWRVNP